MIMIKKYLKKLSLETDNMFKKLSKINHFFRFYHFFGVKFLREGQKNRPLKLASRLFFAPPGKNFYAKEMIKPKKVINF